MREIVKKREEFLKSNYFRMEPITCNIDNGRYNSRKTDRSSVKTSIDHSEVIKQVNEDKSTIS